MIRNVTSLREKRGPDFERWARAIAQGVIRTVDNAKAAHVLDARRDQV
jgi:hypothetical protein